MNTLRSHAGKIALAIALALCVGGFAYKKHCEDIARLQALVSELDTSVNKLDANAKALRAENGDLRKEIDALNSELRTAKEGWKADLAALVAKMSEQSKGFEKELAAVSDELWKTREALRGEIANGNVQAKDSLAALQERIDGLNKKIVELKESVEVAQIFKDADYLVDIHVHFNKQIAIGNMKFWITQTYDGSGAVVDWNGRKLIVTACHLIRDLDIRSIDVRFNNDRFAPEEVEVVGYCECHDDAVFQFKNRNFVYTGKTAKLGCSANLVVGSPVVALGSGAGLPFCLSPKGTVMNLRRGINDIHSTQPELIEHSSYINPGNSGGPLMLVTDGEPEMVGVNVMLIPTYVPPALAMPIDDVKRDMPAMLAANGHGIVHGTLTGVEVGDSLQITDGDLKKLGVIRPAHDGIMVVGVAKGSPAEAAGLKVGDIVLTYNDTDMRGRWYNKLMNEILYSAPGSLARLLVERSGAEVKVNVLLDTYITPKDEDD